MELLKSSAIRKLENERFDLWLDQIKTMYQAIGISSVLSKGEESSLPKEEKVEESIDKSYF